MRLTLKKPPKILIRYNEMLDEVFLVYVKNAPQYKNTTWATWIPWKKDSLKKNIELCESEWKKHEISIIKAIEKITGVRFLSSLIVVHVVSANPRNIGRPIIIRGTFKPEKFVVSLTHELIHELFNFNDGGVTERSIVNYARRILPNESNQTYKHILVYAVMQYVFEDALKRPGLYKVAVDETTEFDNYRRAVETVFKLGHKNILRTYRKASRRNILRLALSTLRRRRT